MKRRQSQTVYHEIPRSEASASCRQFGRQGDVARPPRQVGRSMTPGIGYYRGSLMYDWLAREISAVKEQKFFVVDGPADRKLRRAIQRSTLSAPNSYKEFVLRFGNCKLYRMDNEIDRYHLEVFASMREAETVDKQDLLLIGSFGGRPAYFKATVLAADDDCPVFEWVVGPHSYLQQAATSFGEWITKRAQQARKKYGQRRWKAILAGPEPWTAQERRIVKARKRFRWQIVGVAKNRNVKFKVHNGSDMVLPYLSIGIDNKDSTLGGGVELPIASIRPGQTKTVEIDCYKSLVSPEEIVAYDYPTPGPEDRHRYAEFAPPD